MFRASSIIFKDAPKSVTQTVKDAASYVAETVAGGGATASKEANKAVAKDSDASASTRLGAAKDAVGDKVNEVKHNATAEVDKQSAKH
ncbi:hypothetical protein CBS101457_003046 [Exobasidium rhododendri]|nr:hypothetical protein CBS101457_003046 [Exobasidium rhododendri]